MFLSQTIQNPRFSWRYSVLFAALIPIPQAHADYRNSEIIINNIPNFLSGFKRLQSGALEDFLSGKMLTPSRDTRQRFIPFSEIFYKDRRWRIDRQERALNTNFGVWYVKAGQICVRVSDQPEICRVILVNIPKDAVSMPDIEFDDVLDSPLIMDTSLIPTTIGAHQ